LSVFFHHLFHDFPIPLAGLGLFGAEVALVNGEFLKVGDIGGLFTDTSLFSIAPTQHGEYLVATDELNAFSDLSHLHGSSVQ